MGCCLSKPGSTRDDNKARHQEAKNGKPKLIAGGFESLQLDDQTLNKYRKGERCQDVYSLGRLLGKGGYATVRLGTHKRTEETYAIKIMSVTPKGTVVGSNDNTWKDVEAEIAILCKLDHPNVIGLKEFFFDDSNVYLITDLIQGGELLHAVAQIGSYGEAEARKCFRQLLEGVAYIHEHGIAHRDLKLENLLLETPGDISRIRIVDFGLAKGHAGIDLLKMDTVCGTPDYVAPEIIAVNGAPGMHYGPEVDLWACGVVLYVLLSGQPPFFHRELRMLYRKIALGQYAFQDPIWDMVSEDAKDLIRKLLVRKPSERWTAKQALQHPWMLAGRSQGGAILKGAQANMMQLPGVKEGAARMSVDIDRLGISA